MQTNDIDKLIFIGDHVSDRMDDGRLREITGFGEITGQSATVFMEDGGVMGLDEIKLEDICIQSAIRAVEIEIDEDITLTGWEIEINGQKRQQNQRADDSEISTAIASAEPQLLKSQILATVRRLEEVFAEELKTEGLQGGARKLLDQVHKAIGDRRGKLSDGSWN